MKLYSKNLIKNKIYYNSKYIININTNGNYNLYTLLEYNKTLDDYKDVKSSYNKDAFIEYLKLNTIIKYFNIEDIKNMI